MNPSVELHIFDQKKLQTELFDQSMCDFHIWQINGGGVMSGLAIAGPGKVSTAQFQAEPMMDRIKFQAIPKLGCFHTHPNWKFAFCITFEWAAGSI